MLVFALKYRDALDVITGDREMKLRQFEMDDEEWDLAQQLCEVLKASFLFLSDAQVDIHPTHRCLRTPPFFSRVAVHQISQR
jgi:hypothetical protein